MLTAVQIEINTAMLPAPFRVFATTVLICAAGLTANVSSAHADLNNQQISALKTDRVQFKSLPGYTKAQTRIANKIASRFAAAGYGRAQQIAAVSVAIRESTLNPKALNRGCKCYGLFQLNRGNGLGTGHSPTNLKDADYNIRLIIGEANRFRSFKTATNIDSAISSFVRNVTRPANKSRVVRATIKTARMVERSASSIRLAAAE